MGWPYWRRGQPGRGLVARRRRVNGPLFGLGMLGRAMFLAWVVATGLWLYRTDPHKADTETTPVGKHMVSD